MTMKVCYASTVNKGAAISRKQHHRCHNLATNTNTFSTVMLHKTCVLLLERALLWQSCVVCGHYIFAL